jgi:hypothetical protein
MNLFFPSRLINQHFEGVPPLASDEVPETSVDTTKEELGDLALQLSEELKISMGSEYGEAYPEIVERVIDAYQGLHPTNDTDWVQYNLQLSVEAAPDRQARRHLLTHQEEIWDFFKAPSIDGERNSIEISGGVELWVILEQRDTAFLKEVIAAGNSLDKDAMSWNADAVACELIEEDDSYFKDLFENSDDSAFLVRGVALRRIQDEEYKLSKIFDGLNEYGQNPVPNRGETGNYYNARDAIISLNNPGNLRKIIEDFGGYENGKVRAMVEERLDEL